MSYKLNGSMSLAKQIPRLVVRTAFAGLGIDDTYSIADLPHSEEIS